MQTLEYNVGDDEELAEILKRVRTKVDCGEIGENDFSRIHAEMVRQKKLLHSRSEAELPDGVLTSEEFIFILEKEIARARRYAAVFSALAFSLVSAKPQVKDLEQVITKETVLCVALNLLAKTFRDADFVGQIGNNKIVALLPMIGPADGRKALNRVMRVLHANPLQVGPVPVQIRIAGVLASCNGEQQITAQQFSKQLSDRLNDMAARLKNIQNLI
jgi:GGDEF domain-containing protein